MACAQRERGAGVRVSVALGALVAALLILQPLVVVAAARGVDSSTMPVKHVVVIYQENISFDHYFGTYPVAQNPTGEPDFHASPATPSINGLGRSLQAPNNPNTTQPFRLDRSQAVTCDQNHNYTAEQRAYNMGLMDKFPEMVGVANTITVGIPPDTRKTACDYGHGPGLVMGYYDGNTVTALWNYAQKYALSDNTFETTFGPSTPGNVNLISGQTHGFTPDGTAVTVNDTIVGDPQPEGDICSTRDTSTQVPASTDKNIGDLLSAKNVTWGWFQGGFRETSGTSSVTGQPTTNTCQIGHANVGGVFSADYVAHHESFQYYRSTQNLQHLPPTSAEMIGKDDQAHHQYDLSDFWVALDNHNLPSVSFLKAPAYQDGHPAYSDPLDEQTFLVSTINRLQDSESWNDMAIFVLWDDSDGWYDHQMGPIVNQSNDPDLDALAGDNCGLNPNAVAGGFADRCGYGPRVPLLLISPFAKPNYVDHALADQSSVLRFIEDNWQTGQLQDGSFDGKAGSLAGLFDVTQTHDDGNRQRLILDPDSGQPRDPDQSLAASSVGMAAPVAAQTVLGAANDGFER